MNHTSESLMSFEKRILDLYQKGKIQSPVHLVQGNESTLIEIFKEIKDQDWVFSTWRSHYHCLLKGVPEQQVEAKILQGFSITLCFPDHKIYSSAIVGGIVPVAVGTAMSIKRNKQPGRVWCFLGDTTSETGIAHESIKYARNHQLPVTFIIEDNGKGITSDTREVWNQPTLTYQDSDDEYVRYYRYQSCYPHSGGMSS